ncbi:histidine kinase [Paenibacillus oryzisoli]|uniref:sensor histidine kinase n=1 Tax=Paenibacillus oryzisoli TaxID=1850517 RepID=UPI003D2A0F04
MKGFFRNWGLRTQLVVTFIILITIPLIIFGFRYYTVSSNIVSEIVEKNMYDVVKKNTLIMDSKLSQAKDNMISFLVDPDLYTAFTTIQPTDDYQISLLDKKISLSMDKYFSNLQDIYSVQLSTSYATFRTSISPIATSFKNFIPVGGIKRTSMYTEAVKQQGKLVWIPTYNFSDMFNVPYLANTDIDFRYMFSAVEIVNGAYVDEINYEAFAPDIERPVLIVNYKEDFFRNVFQSSLPVNGSFFFIVTQGGQYVSHLDSEKIGTNDHYDWLQSIITQGSGVAKVHINGKDTLISYDTSKTTGWVSILLIPQDQLLSAMLGTMKSYLFYSFILLVIIFIFTSYFVTGRITKPLLNLLKALRQTGEGNFEISMNEKGSKELIILSKQFETMNQKIHRLIEENYKSKIKEKEAEITALNLQLDPHFMYNTLNIINLISIENGQDEISEMIVSLSNMLKYTVKMTAERVPFTSDWEYLQSYILIMSKRFEGRFRVETKIEPELFVFGVPKFFLQPFVENAFVHAFESRKSGGILTITGRIQDGCRIFEVMDNGSGIEEEMLERIKRGEEGAVGVQNVNNRIKIMYGENYGVTFESIHGQWTKVTIRIPED